MKDSSKPKEHPTFQRNTLLVAFLLLGIGFLLGAISIYYDNRGEDSPVPGWTIVTVIALFLGWVFYRTLLARPHCPTCRSSDTEHRFDYSENRDNSGNSQAWRRYKCNSCEAEFLIPGLSSDS